MIGRLVHMVVMTAALAGGCGGGTPAAHDSPAGATVGPGAARTDAPAPPADGLDLLSRYPQSAALAQTRQTYAEAGAGTGGRQSLLMTTWFPRGDARVGEWSTIDPRGRVAIYRFVHDLGFQDSRTTSLVESQVPELTDLLATLPPSTTPAPPLERLLVVGFRRPTPDGGEWVTRLYDRARPPVAVRRIFHEMTGAPLGSE